MYIYFQLCLDKNILCMLYILKVAFTVFYLLCICPSDCLKTVFSWLGFQVEVQRDCTSERILSLMEELAGRSQQDWDCVVCCVLSHGLEGCVHGVDYKPVNIKMLLEPFIGTKCPSMAGKPKLFFIQACQGIEEQGIVYLGGDRPEHSDVDTDVLLLKESIPSHSDFLLGMSTVPGFVSLRERTNGTWYIQSLCQNLVDMVPRLVTLVPPPEEKLCL